MWSSCKRDLESSDIWNCIRYTDLVADSIERGEAPLRAREGLEHDLTEILACRVRNVSIARPLVVRPLAMSAKEEVGKGSTGKSNLILEVSSGRMKLSADVVMVQFFLPRGSYATSLLREIGVVDPSHTIQN